MMFADMKVAPEARGDAVDTWRLCTEMVREMLKHGASQFQVAAAIHDICLYMGWYPDQVLRAADYAGHRDFAEVRLRCNSPGNRGTVGL